MPNFIWVMVSSPLHPQMCFLQWTGVSPDEKFRNEQGYCKMVILKKDGERGLPPSAMWREFWTDHPELTSYLDETSLNRNTQGDVPRVWAEPIPGIAFSPRRIFRRFACGGGAFAKDPVALMHLAHRWKPKREIIKVKELGSRRWRCKTDGTLLTRKAFMS